MGNIYLAMYSAMDILLSNDLNRTHIRTDKDCNKFAIKIILKQKQTQRTISIF